MERPNSPEDSTLSPLQQENDPQKNTDDDQAASLYEATLLPSDGRRYIRLLTILPRNSTDMISCTLKVHLLDEAPPYETLSYCWGAQKPAVQITCNGIAMSVGPNLGTALRRLRNREGSREMPIWIDAVCINQSMSALAERSHQVSFMKDIYERSKKVLIWLGEGYETTQAAMVIIRRAAEYCREEGATSFRDTLSITMEGENSSSKQQRDLPLPYSSQWDPVIKLLNNPWFERIWVVQEASSTLGEVMIGHKESVSWLDMLSAACWLELKTYLGSNKATRASSIHIFAVESRWQGGQPLTAALLRSSAALLATDPRDKVYALYGMASQNKDLNNHALSTPNYKKSVVEVFRDIVRYLLIHTNLKIDDSIFTLIALTEGNGEDGFPSWVPRIDLPLYPKVDSKFVMSDLALNSGDRWYAGTSLPTEIRDSEPSSLVIRGIIGAEVLQCQAFFSDPFEIPTREDLDTIYTTIFSHWILSNWRSSNTQDTGVFKDKFVPTITAGRSKDFSGTSLWTASDLDNLFEDSNDDSDGVKRFLSRLSRHGNNIIFLDGGRFGISNTKGIQEGDLVCIFFGQKAPFVIRPCGHYYIFIGDCYVNDFMFGQATEEWKAGKLKDQWIELR